ncbi:MAG: type I restriction endonuclease [Acidobacteriota bacterium]
MDFADRIAELARRATGQIDAINTEEATKNALVMPFINALGYDVFNPREVIPEYTADVGVKKGEKVDYAIMADGRPTILFESKSATSSLDEAHASQLFRYFSVTEARFGVLTNGLDYRFFSDLEAPNKMDSKPFLVIDLRRVDDSDVEELKKFSKDRFDLENILENASDLKYTRAVKKLFAQQLVEPSDEFARFFASQIYDGRITQGVLEQFARVTKTAMAQFISERISERLRTALATEQGSTVETSPDPASVPNSKHAEKVEVDDDGIETTEDELQGYYIVTAILSRDFEPNRIAIRDRKTYCGILLDDNNRKPVCRLWFNTSQYYLGLFDEEKEETRHPINAVEEIYRFADQIRETAHRYVEAGED